MWMDFFGVGAAFFWICGFGGIGVIAFVRLEIDARGT